MIEVTTHEGNEEIIEALRLVFPEADFKELGEDEHTFQVLEIVNGNRRIVIFT